MKAGGVFTDKQCGSFTSVFPLGDTDVSSNIQYVY